MAVFGRVEEHVLGRWVFAQFVEEVLKGAVARRSRDVQAHSRTARSCEEIAQDVVLDTAREGPATQHPVRNAHLGG